MATTTTTTPAPLAAAPSTPLALPDEPALAFRRLHQELHSFASQTMDEDDALAFMTRLLGHAPALLAPVALPAPQASERQALTGQGKVQVAGKTIDVSPAIQHEILRLSDEFRVSEARGLELWFLASDAPTREWIERVDQLPRGALTAAIPAAARHFLLTEVEYKINLIKELLRLRFDDRLEKKRRQFVLSYTNQLLADGLLGKLLSALQDELPRLMEVAPLQQAASYWHDLLAEAALFAVSSTRVLPQEVQQLAEVMRALCTRLNTVVAKVSPHIVNLTQFAQLFESGSLAGTSPEGVVKQVSCILRAMTTVQVALMVVLLETRDEAMDRATGEMVRGRPLGGPEHAATVRALHQLIFEQEWDKASFQSVSRLVWAAFLASQVEDSGVATANVTQRTTTSGNVFAEVEAVPRVVKAALEKQVFTSLVGILLKYLPDAKHDALLYSIFERHLELLLIQYSSKLMVDVPTVADQAVLAQMQSESEGDVASWEGDCLENIVAFAIALCARNPAFARAFWPGGEDLHSSAGECFDHGDDHENCHEFLLACRDAAFKNPACLPAYLQLVAAAAEGPDCAQLAFHHIKQNPPLLSWDHFFGVMSKYQRMLTDAERGALGNGYSALSPAGNVADPAFDARRGASPGPRFIRPKELEGLEAIQAIIQAVIRDQQLALIFFHNHDWSPIQTFVTFLQCRVPSSLKGELMKTLALFAQVPEVAPFVWRQMDSLQILRTTADAAVYGHEDIAYELEHYESLSRRYPATRGFVALLHELFENPHAWNAFEGDGRIAAIQHYFDFLLEKVFLKFDLRKYEDEDEKWTLAHAVLGIFKKVLRSRGATGTAEGSLAYQLLQRLLSGSALLEKLFYILSTDGGVDHLESTATNVHLEHAFFFCLDYAKKQTEATHGALNFIQTSSAVNRRKGVRPSTHGAEAHGVSTPRERCVKHALEIIMLVLEKDTAFVNSDVQKQLTLRAQVELLHTILFRHRSDFVHIIQYVKYTKSSYIPQLSINILRSVSNRVSGGALVDLLVDSGASGDIMIGYMNRLLSVYGEDGDDADSSLHSERRTSYLDMDDEMNSGTVKFQTPKKRRRRATSSASSDVSTTVAASSIRRAILDLFLDNLEKPAPNVAHLLLGVLHGNSTSGASNAGSLNSGLDVILTLLCTAEFGLEFPDLAQRCHKIIHRLITQEFSSATVISVLENPRCDFFATQLRLFADVFQLRRRRDTVGLIGELNLRGWFFKTLAVYIHVALQKEPPHIKKINKLVSLLLLTSTHEDAARQDRMLLLRFLNESTVDIYPPDVPTNQHAVGLAERVTQTVDEGYFKWLRIDIEKFCEALQAADMDALTGGFSVKPSKRLRSSGGAVSQSTDDLLQWAISWNNYSERVAAESHGLNSLRELAEVLVLDYLAFNTDDRLSEVTFWQGLDAIASAEVRVELLSGIVSTLLVKLTDRPRGSAQLFEIIAKLLLLLFSELRQSFASTVTSSESRRRQNATYVELLFKAVCCTSTATGNPVAAQNSRTLLYSCIVNVLSVMPATMTSSDGFFLPTSLDTRSSQLTGQVVDLLCRDASESGDVLSMALAVAGLEAMTAANGTPITKILRERGYLLHFIGIFRQLCELDAAIDRDGNDGAAARKHLPQGVDATTIGTVYECFLSLFTRVAGTTEGAVALLEGGLVRALAEARNLPSHRPKLVFPGERHGFGGNQEAYRRAEGVFTRKWLPLLRLISGLCSTLTQNRTLTQQVLRLISQHRKLFTGSLKLAAHEKPTLSLLREVAHSTFVFRYVTQFPDLCDQELSAIKWEKIAQAILRVFLLYASEVVPVDTRDGSRMSDQDSVWWQKTVPRLATEHRDDAIPRLQRAEDVEEELAERTDATRDLVGLFRLTAFGEEKLYTSRMILCNAVAFCASRMLKATDLTAAPSQGLVPGRSLLLAATATSGKKPTSSSLGATAALRFPVGPEAVDRRAFVASVDPLWSHAPGIGEMVTRLHIAVAALESAQLVHREVHGAIAQAQPLTEDLAYLRHLVEYHVDSLAFVVENVLVVLLTHFAHFAAHPEATKAAPVQPLLLKTLEIAGAMAENPFVHAICRRLRELAAGTSGGGRH